MPRWTKRQKLLRKLRKELQRRRRAAATRFLHAQQDAFDDEYDELVEDQLVAIESKRYIARPASYRHRQPKWQQMLDDDPDSDEFLNEDEFLGHFRIIRDVFHRLVACIRDHEVFQTEPQHRHRGDVELHLMILLKHFGSYGNANSASNLAHFFGVGKGSIPNYLDRAVTAVLSVQKDIIKWPDEAERREIGRRIQEDHGFPNCVGLIDGTLLPLAFPPATNPEDYITRKSTTAVHALITCDDVVRVRDVIVGWPGSVHDNRVWSNGRLCQNPQGFFSPGEYLLGDSAFKPSEIMVPAFKKPPKGARANPHQGGALHRAYKSSIPVLQGSSHHHRDRGRHAAIHPLLHVWVRTAQHAH